MTTACTRLGVGRPIEVVPPFLRLRREGPLADELTILQRVADGDASAMHECIDAYSGLVWRLTRRMLPDTAEADDAVQDVFVSLWEHADRYDPSKGKEVTFVAMMARRRLIDRGRRQLSERRLRDRVEHEAAGDAAPAAPTAPPVPDASGIVSDEEQAAVQAALHELPEKQRDLLLLSIRTGQSHQQLAEQTGMPLGTVKTNIRRGMIRVRSLLGLDERPGMAAAGESMA